MPGLLWDPLLRVALLDVDVVLFQEAICCRSSVETVTMHSSEGSEAAAAHELFMREPTLCRDFMTGVWAVEWMVDEITKDKWGIAVEALLVVFTVMEDSMTKSENVKDLLSALVSRRLGRVPTFSVCGLRPVSDAPLWRRLCVPCTPRSVVPELSERH